MPDVGTMPCSWTWSGTPGSQLCLRRVDRVTIWLNRVFVI
jgi:hypothetical protein